MLLSIWCLNKVNQWLLLFGMCWQNLIQILDFGLNQVDGATESMPSSGSWVPSQESKSNNVDLQYICLWHFLVSKGLEDLEASWNQHLWLNYWQAVLSGHQCLSCSPLEHEGSASPVAEFLLASDLLHQRSNLFAKEKVAASPAFATCWKPCWHRYPYIPLPQVCFDIMRCLRTGNI